MKSLSCFCDAMKCVWCQRYDKCECIKTKQGCLCYLRLIYGLSLVAFAIILIFVIDYDYIAVTTETLEYPYRLPNFYICTLLQPSYGYDWLSENSSVTNIFYLNPANQISSLQYVYVKVDGFCTQSNCNQENFTHYCFVLNANTLKSNQINISYNLDKTVFQSIIVRVWNFDIVTNYNQSTDGTILGKHVFISDQPLGSDGVLSQLETDYFYLSLFDVSVVDFEKGEIDSGYDNPTRINIYPAYVYQIPLTGSKYCSGDNCTAKGIVSIRATSPIVTKTQTENVLSHFQRIASELGGLESLLVIILFTFVLKASFGPWYKCCNPCCPDYHKEHSEIDIDAYENIKAYFKLHDLEMELKEIDK